MATKAIKLNIFHYVFIAKTKSIKEMLVRPDASCYNCEVKVVQDQQEEKEEQLFFMSYFTIDNSRKLGLLVAT
ncbi:hypothetical protein CR513_38387, partial [Mucuna pruriens]